MGFQKGQAALDFLMTYGWAIALVVIIAGVLFALGIFDVSNFVGSKAAGFSGVAVKGWKLDTAGNLELKVTNEVGNLITINNVTATIGTNSTTNSTAIPLAVGEDSGSITLSGFSSQSAGTGYTAKVIITYTDRSSDFQYTSTGKLNGKATE
ncbi:Uncharacterised protein [uncultured archaeon]|nr:Uncharacterised protein [uncultured archaeon]